MFKLRSLVTVFTLALLLMLAACGGEAPAPAAESGGGEAAQSSGGAEVAAEAEEATEEPAEAASSSGETIRQAFGGGPVGGAFQTFANAMSLIVADANDNLELSAEGTGGSGANLRGVHANDVQYGISYAGDIYLGGLGQLPDDPVEYTDVRPVASLYGGRVHLVVRADSGIETVADLEGKRIAPGNAGSGAAISAERFFRHLGLWDKMTIEFLGYSQAAAAMGDGQLDGFWILAAFPNSSVTEATTVTDIKLIDLDTPAKESGFYEAMPFYTPAVLDGGAYEGVPDDVGTFQDTAIWIAHKDVPDDVVYDAVSAVFSDEGLERMREAHPAAGEMTVPTGANGIPVPLHPGAANFWLEQGTMVPDAALPEGMSNAESSMPAEEAASTDGAAMGIDPSTVIPEGETVRQAFGGGPVGGAFQTFANAMSLIVADAISGLELSAEGTGGSGANLRGVHANDVQYGISYAGDIYLGGLGQLPDDPVEYTDVRPVASLYGGRVHLVVRADSGIETVADLEGKRIAPGNAGSGAAISAERFFRHLGLWDKMTIEFLGYSQAAAAMGDGQLDGFWILAAFPNSSVTEATTVTDIKLIDLDTPAKESGFYEAMPFYTPAVLDGGAYEGVPDDVGTFQDTAIWIAHKDVPDEIVQAAVQSVFSDEGLERMREAHPAAGEMTVPTGVNGIPVPLHPGAANFWQSQGTEIPENILPQ